MTSEKPSDNSTSQVFNFLDVFGHHFWKGLRIGSFVGIGLVAPLIMIRKYKSWGQVVERSQFIKYQLYSILFGEAVSMFLMLQKYIFWDDKHKGLRDEALKIK